MTFRMRLSIMLAVFGACDRNGKITGLTTGDRPASAAPRDAATSGDGSFEIVATEAPIDAATAVSPPADAALANDGVTRDSAADQAPLASASGWRNRTPDPLPINWPPGTGAMAYDSARKRMVMFPGDSSGLFPVWEFDGVRWENRTPAQEDITQPGVVWPAPRNGVRVAYDEARKVTVLYGGSPGRLDEEIFEWNGTTFHRPSATPPTQAGTLGLVYDPKRKVTVLFTGPEKVNVWDWDGVVWTNRSPAPLPASWPNVRRNDVWVWDNRRERVVMFGGEVAVGSEHASTNELLTWDGQLFTVVDPSASTETWPWKGTYSGIFDSSRGVMLLFGGFINDPTVPLLYGPSRDMWEWNPVTGAFANRTPPALRPGEWPPEFGGLGLASAYDSDRGRLVIVASVQHVDEVDPTIEMWEWGPPPEEGPEPLGVVRK